MDNSEWDQLILGLRNGDEKACTDFWNQYGPMLQGVAQKQLSDRLQRRVGSDDVVQSACRTFFRRISEGQFDVPDADALWRLMCAITLTKARRAARDHSRLKRGMQSEQYLDAHSDDPDSPQIQLSGKEQAPVDAVAFADQMDQLLSRLNPQECQVLDLKLQNHTNDEIASKVGCSERTVRRVTAQIKERWSAIFDSDTN